MNEHPSGETRQTDILWGFVNSFPGPVAILDDESRVVYENQLSRKRLAAASRAATARHGTRSDDRGEADVDVGLRWSDLFSGDRPEIHTPASAVGAGLSGGTNDPPVTSRDAAGAGSSDRDFPSETVSETASDSVRPLGGRWGSRTSWGEDRRWPYLDRYVFHFPFSSRDGESFVGMFGLESTAAGMTVTDTAAPAYGPIAEVFQAAEEDEPLSSFQNSRRALETLLGNLPGMAYRCNRDRQWTMEFISRGCVELTGYQPEDIIDNRYVAYGDLIVPDDREMVWRTIQDRLRRQAHFEIQYRIRGADGAVKHVWERGVGVFDSAGRLLALEGIVSDVSERTQAEVEVRRSLAEKEVLLTEIHHRVKNNLQIVASLLNLQISEHGDALGRESVQESIDRIHAITLIHEALYQSGDFVNINVRNQFENLVSYLKTVYDTGNTVVVSYDIDVPSIPLHKAVPISLVVNEVVTNSFKYAFGETSGGEITITMRMIEHDAMELIVADSGAGYSPHDSTKKEGSLGLTLIEVLVAQLHGTMEVDTSHGTRYRFKLR